jgi:hypothetical protein
MAHRVLPLFAATLAVTLASAAAAQRRPTVAIMPAQYFKADAESAENLTRALAQQFQSERYRVIPIDRSERLFHSMGLSPTMPISDTRLRQFGRRIGADLVVRPQLMGVGLPLNPQATASDTPTPKAVLYLRVLNVRTGQPLYTRQVAHYFAAEPTATGEYTLSPTVATAAAAQVSRPYFERVAGSRQEIGRPSRR